MDLSLTLRDLQLSNPIGVASGTFGYGKEYDNLVNFECIGAIYTKAITPEPRIGNPAPRLAETPAGMLNSVGLANVGLESFVTDKLPYLLSRTPKTIVNVAGAESKDYLKVVETLEKSEGIAGYEINISCPNVSHGGMSLGTDPYLVEELTKQIRKLTTRPLIIKLSPNVTDITEIAKAAEDAGADAVSCINTLVGMVIDIRKKRPVLSRGTGGLSGPAILPVAVACVWKVSRAVKIPVIGIGGINKWEDAVQHLMAGASAIQLGSGIFRDPQLPEKVYKGILQYAQQQKYTSIKDFWIPQ